ncbi:MAG: Sfum_1244 family protein [Thiotrichales bacterium]
MFLDVSDLKSVVQRNCHIADAQHAGDYTLCTYLMKMRELYRWEKGLGFTTPLTTSEVGSWVREREAVWETLEDSEFAQLPIHGDLIHPFESDLINQALLPEGLVYSGGFGRKAAPHFFLAELDQNYDRDGYTVVIAGREFARDLTSPPAMSRGNTIYLRKESLRRMIWERVQEWQFHPTDNPMGRALSHYPLEEDLEAALDALVEDLMMTFLKHEIGEVRAGREIGGGWQPLVAAVAGSRAELELRAVRDNLADSLETLPYLLQTQRPELLHFYFATFSAMRREMFPALHSAYQQWITDSEDNGLEQAVRDGQGHWLEVSERALEIHQQTPDKPSRAISNLIAESRL